MPFHKNNKMSRPAVPDGGKNIKAWGGGTWICSLGGDCRSESI